MPFLDLALRISGYGYLILFLRRMYLLSRFLHSTVLDCPRTRPTRYILSADDLLHQQPISLLHPLHPASSLALMRRHGMCCVAYKDCAIGWQGVQIVSFWAGVKTTR